MKLKLGITNSPLRNYCSTEAEGLKLISDVGFDCIDYYIARYALGNPNCNDTHTERQDYFLQLRDSLADTNTTIHQTHAVFPTYVGNKATDAKLFDSLCKSIEATNLLGAKYMVVHPVKLFWHRYDVFKPLRKRLNMQFYRSLLPYLQANNVTVAIENMFTTRLFKKELRTTTCSRAEEMLDFVQELDDPHFTLCFDSGHANLLYDNSGIEMVRKLGDKISICHLHDNDGISDYHRLPYHGNIDWHKLILAMRSFGYNGVLSFECHYADNTASLNEVTENMKKILAAGQQFNRFWEEHK